MKQRHSSHRHRSGTDARLVAGVGPVLELLSVAPHSIRRVLVARGKSRGESSVQTVADKAAAAGVSVRELDVTDLDALLPPGARHQGVVAEAKPYQYADTDEMIALAADRGEAPLIVAVDGVTDPHNLGAIARSALLLGAHGLVVPRDRNAEVNPTSTKASAGAVEHLLIAQVTNLVRTLQELKDEGLWVHGVASSATSRPADELDLSGPIVLVFGSEGEGLRPLVAKQCDVAVEIPMRSTAVGSFNVSVAAAITLYEVDRQRRARG